MKRRVKRWNLVTLESFQDNAEEEKSDNLLGAPPLQLLLSMDPKPRTPHPNLQSYGIVKCGTNSANKIFPQCKGGAVQVPQILYEKRIRSQPF